MFFRFGAAIGLIVIVCLIGIAIEKRNLDLRRELSQQHARSEEFREAHARLRLKTQQLGSTSRLMQDIPKPEPEIAGTEHIHLEHGASIPLLRWRSHSSRTVNQRNRSTLNVTR
ncbi:hypothetical protein Pla110_25910 [Polystyrenella longa]|uniref:Cell division protein FtsL n=1 Tax=Polystyrenella longa TaxID=2528007 RepID=A0A518CNQ2_9PLAN|nr:hypothetical protein [Polystyrenella longa]QDU80855.1 hypothetical protein Pla110_25910 [Polystyrenella longa]